MNWLTKYKFSVFFSICGFISLMAYTMIGSHVDENGILVEPFGLLGLFWIFQLLALIAWLVVRIKQKKSARS